MVIKTTQSSGSTAYYRPLGVKDSDKATIHVWLVILRPYLRI